MAETSKKRGRPPLGAAGRTERFSIRVTNSEHSMLRSLAEKQECTMGDVVRQMIRREFLKNKSW